MSGVTRSSLLAELRLRDQACERLVCQCLGAIGVPYVRGPQDAERPDWVVLDCGHAEALSALPERSLILSHGERLQDVLLIRLQENGGKLMRTDDLTPERMLRVLFASEGGSTETLSEYLSTLLPGRPESRPLVTLFASAPAATARVEAVARAVRYHKRRVPDLVHALRFERLEHLWTYLRAESLVWLTHQGIRRKPVERFLGIFDRSNFRRACRRAGVPVPWRGGW